jgi:hypothetical protein
MMRPVEGSNKDPHHGQPVFTEGEPLDKAISAMLLIHGRGATAQDILSLVTELEKPGWAYLAPQAANHTWYPESFMVSIERNEPWLTSALDFLTRVLQVFETAGIPAERTLLLGFPKVHTLRWNGALVIPGGMGGLPGSPAA